MSQGIKYNVDIVFVIDVTGSMGPYLEKTKENALKFHENLKTKMEAKNKNIDALRLKVVYYRDLKVDGTGAMGESSFFSLPDQDSDYKAFVSGLKPSGGGDEPESGLEALTLAIKSPWTTSGDKKRYIIVLSTDASAHKLEEKHGSGMPTSFNELTDIWCGQTMDSSAKRLIMFAPDVYPWTDISAHWDNSIHVPTKAGEGIGDTDYDTILDTISNSV